MPIPTYRHEKTYVLFESHFDAITAFNTASFVCFSLAGVFFSVFVSMASDWMFAVELSPTTIIVTKVIAWISGLSSLVLTGGGLALFFQKKTQVDKIKDNTKAKDATLDVQR